ncbi:hypothetical protein BH23PLA1_BH23PLA1_05390 [soil metagenome]
MSDPLRLMVIGAHPDDAEYKAGGLASKYRRLGHEVRFVSMTNGDAGHHQISGPPLAARRRAEAEVAAKVVGLTYDILDNSDGRIEPNLDRREDLIRRIRRFRPDLLLTHRPNDYHPDHRVTAQLVQDAAYLLTVPAICPDVPHLRRDPVIAYLSDNFTRPCSFRADVVVDITEVWEDKIAMMHAHVSQFYEWLPYNMWDPAEVPDADEERRAWLSERMADESDTLAQWLAPAILLTYGAHAAAKIRHIEAFEGSEYGSPLDGSAHARLFPFVLSTIPSD